MAKSTTDGIRIITWNTQGNPANNEMKQNTLESLLGQCEILMLQECGTYDGPGGNWYWRRTDQAGALNPRCNSGIICNVAPRSHGTIYLPSGTGRFCLYFEYYQTYVATLHAVSGGGGAVDPQAAMAEMVDSLGTGRPIIIGGDFNAEPGELSKGRTRSGMIGTNSRGTAFYKATCGGATHTSGRELDYFIFRRGLSNSTQRYYTTGGSDHYPVATRFLPALVGG